MSALDGKNTIGRGLRSCIVRVPDMERFLKIRETISFDDDRIYKIPERDVKALFHCWHPITGNAIVEYEDGTIQEVEPTQIRFVDNAMSEYAFPEIEK